MHDDRASSKELPLDGHIQQPVGPTANVRQYLIELHPSVAPAMKGICDTINTGKATTIISLGANLTILLGTDTFVKL